jgi:hypothetical protein
MRRRLPTLAFATLLSAATVALSGCFTTTADFGDDAEQFIVENQDLRQALFDDSETTFVEATCVDPENRDEGTTFPCTARDSDGATWEFEIEITGNAEYEVNVSRFPDGE